MVALSLTPVLLVIFSGDAVVRLLALERVQDIKAMARLDAPTQPGVMRFAYVHPDGQRETLAFTLVDHMGFAASLAEAAKRTLEAPPVFHGKKKKDDPDAWEDE